MILFYFIFWVVCWPLCFFCTPYYLFILVCLVRNNQIQKWKPDRWWSCPGKRPARPLYFLFFVWLSFFGGALDDVDSCLTDYLGCWMYVQQTKQVYVYRHVAIKIWGTNYECVLSNGGGSWLARRPGQAGPSQAKRERERENEEIYSINRGTRFCLFRHHFEAIGAFSTKGRHSNETKQSESYVLTGVSCGRRSHLNDRINFGNARERERETRDRAMQ